MGGVAEILASASGVALAFEIPSKYLINSLVRVCRTKLVWDLLESLRIGVVTFFSSKSVGKVPPRTLRHARREVVWMLFANSGF